MKGHQQGMLEQPCPFCGAREAFVMEHGDGVTTMAPHYFYGNCIPCDAEGPPRPTAQEAADAWNKRESPK
jgi:Lar family restriction alleviation protein